MATVDNQLELFFREYLVTIKPPIDGPLQEAHELVAISRGHPTAAAARDFGTTLKDRLLALSVEARIGIDVGKDRIRGGPGKYFSDLVLAEHDIVLLPDIHGLSVYPEDNRHQILRSRATPARIVGVDRFTDILNRMSERQRALPARIQVGAELLSASYFGQSSYATLFLSIAAVESVAVRVARSPENIRLLDIAIAAARGAEGDNEIDSVAQELSALRLGKESIRQSYQRIIGTTLGTAKAKEFRIIYDETRSRIIHGGASFDAWEVWQPAQQAQMIAAELLAKLVGDDSSIPT